MGSNLTIKETLVWAAEYLHSHNIPDPRLEAEYILAYVLNCKRLDLYLNFDKPLHRGELEAFRDLAGRRVRREPSQYIIGEQEFRSLTLKVTRDVLIPRPETELIVEEAIKILTRSPIERPVIIDLCTGGGCIAISAVKEFPSCRVYALDLSENALEVARENAGRYGLADKITFLKGDLFEPVKELGLEGKVSMILSNPPYVPDGELDKLQPEIRYYEPIVALDGGEDGLDFYRRIIAESPLYLYGGGFLILEMGYKQAKGIYSLLNDSGFYNDIEIKKDLAGIERVIKARRI